MEEIETELKQPAQEDVVMKEDEATQEPSQPAVVEKQVTFQTYGR